MFLSEPSLSEWEFHPSCHADISTQANRIISHRKSQVYLARNQDAGCIRFAGDLDVARYRRCSLEKSVERSRPPHVVQSCRVSCSMFQPTYLAYGFRLRAKSRRWTCEEARITKLRPSAACPDVDEPAGVQRRKHGIGDNLLPLRAGRCSILHIVASLFTLTWDGVRVCVLGHL